RLDAEFDSVLDGVNFAPPPEVASRASATLRKRGENVTIALLTKADRIPLGFTMVYIISVREEMQQFLALPQRHNAPLFVNDDVLVKKTYSGWPAWPRPAWYHAAFCTAESIQDLQPMLIAYKSFFQDNGFDVVLEKVLVA